MAYGIAFDIDTNYYKDFIKEKFPELDEMEALKKSNVKTYKRLQRGRRFYV